MLPIHPERRLAIAYAPPAARAGLTALFALDERLGGIVARTVEPTIGLMRLVWWRDALTALDGGPPPAEPLLAAMASAGLSGVALGAMVEGWEALIDDPAFAETTVALHAVERGGRLFRLAGAILGAADTEAERLERAGAAWAQVDLARHTTDSARAADILASARMPLEAAMAARWPRRLRPLGQLVALALDDARRGVGRWREPASPARLLRILRLQLTGR